MHHLQPTTLIESGVNTGLSTFVMRAAAPHARIISIDPLTEALDMDCGRQGKDLTSFKYHDQINVTRFYNDAGKTDQPKNVRNKRWIDNTNNEYLVGASFRDFATIDWPSRVRRGELDPSTTLVFFDDHSYAPDRLAVLRRFGFRHAIFEDNYPRRRYSLKATFWHAGNNTNEKVAHAATAARRHLASYFEFPPIIYRAYPPRSLELQKDVPQIECMLHPALPDAPKRWGGRIAVAQPLLQPYKSERDAERLRVLLRDAVVPVRQQRDAARSLQLKSGPSALGWELLLELAFNDTRVSKNKNQLGTSGQLNMYCHICYVEVWQPKPS